MKGSTHGQSISDGEESRELPQKTIWAEKDAERKRISGASIENRDTLTTKQLRKIKLANGPN